MKKLITPDNSPFFHTHAHSHFSTLDGMPKVADMVRKAASMGQQGLALTDHGNMSGVAQLYKACKEEGIAAFPGEEFYLVRDAEDAESRDTRYHMGMMALDYEGYRALIKLSSRSHLRERFHRKPLIDMADLAGLAESGAAKHIAVSTGCYFGSVAQSIVNHKGDITEAVRLVKVYAKWFPNLFIELQSHNIPDERNAIGDDEMLWLLWEVAQKTGVQTIIAQDAHYCDLADKPDHDLMKKVGYYGAGGSDGAEKDWTFPGDGFHLARTEWVHDHYSGDKEKVWRQSMDAYEQLLYLNRLKIPVLDNYSYHIPPIHKTPMKMISRRCYATLDIMGLSKKQAYIDQIEYELSVIGELGFASYFVLGYEIVDFCKDNGIRISARGSASGSLVCWLLGITQLDPIKWDLMFERFLSLDRVRPPDIDFDIDKFRRHEVIEWLGTRFEVMPIGTYGTLGQNEETGKGSMFVLYMQYERQRLGKEDFDRKYKGITGMADLPKSIQKKLYSLADHEVYKHHGTHAAGVVVTDAAYPLTDLIGTMLVASNGGTVTQMQMDDVEDMGFIKIDLLGLRAEFTMGRTLELLGRSPVDELLDIPLNDPGAYTAIRRGETGSGIFTFEGYTQAKGAKEVKVKNMEDLILVNALYRPATINGGYVKEYLQRKGGKSFDYLDGPGGVFEEVFGNTYGIPVYQEQVLTLLRRIGLPPKELNLLWKAIKASNKKVEAAGRTFDAAEEQFIDLCISNGGMDEDTANEAWQTIKQFSDYSFNRGHSAEYAIRGYWMAYFKVHHPLEFHSALLEGVAMSGGETQKKLEPMYKRECRRLGIRLLGPDVLVSNEYWTMDTRRNAIRAGLTTIKGVGDAVASGIVAARPFTTLSDLIDGSKAHTGRAMSGGKDYQENGNFSGAVLALKDAGALSSLGIEAGR